MLRTTGSMLDHSSNSSANIVEDIEELVDSQTLVGIELEIENLEMLTQSDAYPINLWKEVEEYSIRHGTEFVFKRPHKGKKILDALDDMDMHLRSLRLKGKTPIITSRCSAHVHLDMRNEMPEVVVNTLLVYILFEKILFNYLSNDRQGNNYCIPLESSDFEETLEVVERMLLCPEEEWDMYNFSNYLDSRLTRYGAANLHSLISFGSLEFRAHPGSLKMSNILEWINILLSIKKWAKEQPESLSVTNLIGLDNHTLCKSVFGDLSYKLIGYPEFSKDISDGKQWVISYLQRSTLKKNTNLTLSNTDRDIEGYALHNKLFNKQVGE